MEAVAPQSATPAGRPGRLLPGAMAAAAVLLALVCYWPVLQSLLAEYSADPDMSHGFLVPLAAGFIVYRERRSLPAPRPTAWSIALLVFAAALQFLGATALGLFVSTLGLICAIAALILAAGGFPWLRALAFPLALLLFMLPKPESLWERVTLPLQLLASQLAEWLAQLTATPVLRQGNLLIAAGHPISVEEACSGMRYLLSLTFVSLVWAHISGLRRWRLILMALAALPIAIFVNAVRVAAVAVMCRWNYPYAIGAFHDLSGWIALAIALALLLFVERGLQTPSPPPPEVSGARLTYKPAYLAAAALVLAAQILPVRAAPYFETPPPQTALADFPQTIGRWTGTRTSSLPAAELAALNADDTLDRFYASAGVASEVELRIAYHRSQRVHGRLPHSPQVCLPANGWTPLENRTVTVPGGEVTLYRAAKGPTQAAVLYWYQTPWQTTASEWPTRAFTAFNGLFHRRTDVALLTLIAYDSPDAALQFAPSVIEEMRLRLR